MRLITQQRSLVCTDERRYGNCPHGFTDPLEGHGRYVQQAANQSHTSMRAFYAQLLQLKWTC